MSTLSRLTKKFLMKNERKNFSVDFLAWILCVVMRTHLASVLVTPNCLPLFNLESCHLYVDEILPTVNSSTKRSIPIKRYATVMYLFVRFRRISVFCLLLYMPLAPWALACKNNQILRCDWLPGEGKMKLSCPHGTTRPVPLKTFPQLRNRKHLPRVSIDVLYKSSSVLSRMPSSDWLR